MHVRLRMLQGQFQKTGGRLADEILIRRHEYFIGSDSSCNLRCTSPSVSHRHCAIVIDELRVSVHDLNSESGVYVNDRIVMGSQQLFSGDLLRVGTVEFEVLVGDAVRADGPHELQGDRWRGAPDRTVEQPPPPELQKMDSDISEMLEREDEVDRKKRLNDPDSLRYDTVELQKIHLRMIAEEAARQEEAAQQAEKDARTQRKKSRPGKLPADAKANKAVAEGDSADLAAQDMLSKIFRQR